MAQIVGANLMRPFPLEAVMTEPPASAHFKAEANSF
jgi:hypothetical protein